MIVERSSGVLLHPTSLPGRFGIGDMGKEAYKFIDFLAMAKQKLWQVLPLGHTGFGDSPYQSFSAFAGNINIISPDGLMEIGLLSEDDLKDTPVFSDTSINYGKVIEYKKVLLKIAYEKFKVIDNKNLKDDFENFKKENSSWLDDYALFIALKDYNNGLPWIKWEKAISLREKEALVKWKEKLNEAIEFYSFVQFIFNQQWNKLRNYANSNMVKIIGDTPIFVAYDSAETWAHPELFKLDQKGYPTVIAGVPPDAFSADGQLWGNPIYNWDKMKETGYKWWIEVIKNMLKRFDIIRIDHFRGFAAYWEIPYGSITAAPGKWVKGPGKDLFNAIEKSLGKLPIIAEDLGFITNDVLELRDGFDFPGMNILQFAFGGNGAEERFLPHNHNRNSVVYTGTHDNETTYGAFLNYDEATHKYASQYMNFSDTNNKEVTWGFIRTAFASQAVMAVIPLQDLLCLDNSARMNTPGTQAGNWQWRYTEDMLKESIAKRLADLTALYSR